MIFWLANFFKLTDSIFMSMYVAVDEKISHFGNINFDQTLDIQP